MYEKANACNDKQEKRGKLIDLEIKSNFYCASIDEIKIMGNMCIAVFYAKEYKNTNQKGN